MGDPTPSPMPAGLQPARPRLTPHVSQPLSWRIQALLSSYLPLILMALLASFSWWLLKNTPKPDAPEEAAPARHEFDYRMRNFDLQRVGADGKLRVHVQGSEMRHFPDTDTLEIDGIRLRAVAADGSLTLASAGRALANGDASEIQLLGAVHVQRFDVLPSGEAQAKPKVEMRGEFLHAFVNTEVLKSHVPMQISYANGQMQAQGFEYNNLSGKLTFSGQTRAQFTALPGRATRGPASSKPAGQQP